MAYCSSSNVGAYCRNILQGASSFSASTIPTDSDVAVWLSSGCSVIESTVTGWGYATPPAATTVAYQWFAELNALYTAARVEMARTNVTLAPGERTRGQVFDDMFWKELERLKSRDLSLAGLVRASGVQVYVGGISEDEKQTYEDDSDRVPPRFRRGLHNFPETLRPDASTSAS